MKFPDITHLKIFWTTDQTVEDILLPQQKGFRSDIVWNFWAYLVYLD